MAKITCVYGLLYGLVICLCGGFYRPAVVNPDIRQRLRQVYSAEIGVREATGRNDGNRVREYLQYVGMKEGAAWCSAFVCWAFGKAGIENPKNAWSPALFPEKRVVWERNVVGASPQTGDIFGIYFSELKRIAHCGFVDEWHGDFIITVEGNSTDTRAGPEGVYRKRRLLKTIYQVADWISTN